MMSSSIQTTLCLALALATTLTATAHAGGNTGRALGALQTAYQPTARLSGDARTNQACADASKIGDAATALIHTSPPSGSVVTADVWSSKATDVVSAVDSLSVACKRTDRSYPTGNGKLMPIAEVLQDLDNRVGAVFDAAKPRVLSSPLKAAKAAIDGKHPDAQACKVQRKFAHAIAQVTTPPAGAADGAWSAQYAKVTQASTELAGFACGPHRGADEEIGESFAGLRQEFYALLLLVPPSAR